jgi:hypothetical protein
MARSVEIARATYAEIVYVARRMRALDAEEIYPHLWHPTPEDLSAYCAQTKISFVALMDGTPVVAFGANERFPKVWAVWMFATDDWPKVALSVTKFVRRQMLVEIDRYDPVRLDCWSMDGHDTAHQWLEAFGFIREATVEDYSSARIAYHCYSVTRSRMERENVFYQDAAHSRAARFAAPTPAPGAVRPGSGTARHRPAAAGGERQGPQVHDPDRISGR